MQDTELKKTVNEAYQRAGTSIQAIARDYRLTVEEVLVMIGQEDVMTVEGAGYMIGPDEVDDDTKIVTSKKYKAEFSTN